MRIDASERGLRRSFRVLQVLSFMLAGLMGGLAGAHESHSHSPHPSPTPPPYPSSDQSTSAAKIINESYLASVKPIFQAKCFDCHSSSTRYPWYHMIPLVGWYIDHDIEEAREHLDFSKDYPFVSHATPEEDLEAIEEEIEDDDMPPWDYRLMHDGSKLTDQEKEQIRAWIRSSRELLGGQDGIGRFH